MYRILRATKDAYVTNKIIRSSRSALSSSVDSNVGQAGTIDLFKLYNETQVASGSSGIELSRGLVRFDTDQLRSLTGSFLDIEDPSFKCYLRMKNVQGGQTVPSNFTLAVNPLGKDWDEGAGNDVVGFRDLDSVNWYTASLDQVSIPVPNPPMIEYQEDVVHVLTPSNLATVPFVNPFTEVPPVVITDVSSSLGTVSVFVDNRTSATNLVVSFSSPFSGSFVYRAAYDPVSGSVKTVVRRPRYPGVYANVVLGSVPIVDSNVFSVSYSDFGGNPTDTYATIYETTDDNLTNVYAAVTSSNTVLIGGTFSARITAQVNVLGYRSVDTYYSTNTWTSGGVAVSGVGGDTSGLLADYYAYSNSSLGYVPLTVTQSFKRGDEDLYVDVTPAVRSVLRGDIENYGFRVAFSGSQETDNITRFVKRFSSRQSQNTNLHPALVVKYDTSFIDNQAELFFDYPNKVGIYYTPFGQAANFVSGSSEVLGSGSLMLNLVASASQFVTATTYSLSHRAVISYQSASWYYFSASFTGSQIKAGPSTYQTGGYYADVQIKGTEPGLSAVLQGRQTLWFKPTWTSLDGAMTYANGDDVGFSVLQGSNSVVQSRNYAVNITNLKDVYISTDVPRLRVFVYDFDPNVTSFYLPYKAQPKIFKTMHWRLIDPYTKEVLIPFDEADNGTKLSADGGGMYFDLYMADLPTNRPLEIELLIKEDRRSGYFIENQRFSFKVVNP